MKKIFIASDHGGFEAKEFIKKNILEKQNIKIEDLGTNSQDSVDYPIYAKKVSKEVLNNKNSLGILICGSGAGMQIAANKQKGIRAVFCYDEYSARKAREDNNANILTLRGREFNFKEYENIIKTFLDTKFSNRTRHKKRIEMLE